MMFIHEINPNINNNLKTFFSNVCFMGTPPIFSLSFICFFIQSRLVVKNDVQYNDTIQ
ncbi:hypothetical protein JCM9140_2738 [Halalkalibacter wakoensis JCM 9140]|uniref:Uncharacterized protein n=1 Tax=Halalkalibacter wakoensis JCM 9140 TaxID=1236970 RepID=W4Q5L4_9BACI|nr:hypothetical protein JCM9140_2738 [Halalkalibacter wakoensis JCM 9140]